MFVFMGSCLCKEKIEGDRFEGYPYLDNETIGLFNYLYDMAIEPGLEPVYWGTRGMAKGMGYYQRYLLAFSAYAISMACEHRPAYRKPCIEALDALMQKMLLKQVWEDWMMAPWGGNDPLRPYNIMYTGHLLLMMTLYERHAGDGKYYNDVELVWDEKTRFRTNLKSLAQELAERILTNEDSTGEKYYGICCETNRVFIPCNSIPQYALNILVSAGMDIPLATDKWLEWARERMLDAQSGYFYDMFHPFNSEPTVIAKPHGVWSAWSWTFIDALKPEFASEFYPIFKRSGLSEDYFEEGGAVFLNRPKSWLSARSVVEHKHEHRCPMGRAFERLASKLLEVKAEPMEKLIPPWELLATMFALPMARQMEDEDAYAKLLMGYNVIFGKPRWDESGWYYGYNSLQFLLSAQNAFPLLARAITPEVNMKKPIDNPRKPDFFSQPEVSEISEKIFVNQAIYDPSDKTLYLTISGNTKSPVVITVENVKGAVSIIRNEREFKDWKLSESTLEIYVKDLTSKPQLFRIVIK